MNTVNNTYGQRIRQFRKRAGVTQMELELRIDASFGSVSRMENGLTNPTKETLFAIAQALMLNPQDTAFLFGISMGVEKYPSNLTIGQLGSIYQV